MTLRPATLLKPAAQRLRAAGVASPEADARTLLAGAMGVETWQLATEWTNDADAGRFQELVAARAAGWPLQYLTGVAHFRTVSVAVGPGVFIPRPETEVVTGWAIEHLHAPGVVVELCAGSGAISLAIAAEDPGCRQFAVERDDEAFRWLTMNCAGTAVLPVHADMADAVPELAGTVDLVIANPPYIPSRDRDLVARDVHREPEQALFAGPDGLDSIAVVATAAARLLRPGGWLVCEHDETHGATAPALLQATGGFECIQDHPDLTQRPRFVTARRLQLMP
ncbi:MAG: peptide chain release factor N(5)-glutamine methyltransferase [Propionibacteriaceae bacterium]|nr:peptide chain release factor N(5)-glutamine methyltransferase [Propionibacteriaceae bacterium]